ncbi:MAG: T9SS type A sorting domain-containing protein [Gemmatimonadetes bacterium]|nr:T9SS type A sorting domain-containing protein [Gemmatimonadota bacterium]MBT5059518.1 T9SS type A sorting domain-containing protein [Gemmatimonadota bacterium]MBT5146757.1 T9SS type A sorting domain-containing protein [Gemmatimonadota bacterium]MBT5590046.1 T9SS type A sorting domain-containing protein [Gemmatimonadota bacterium]MBT5960096.1 T9SS type A sorting domain-containing protein [Gemmatimonadota bacterium]
MKHWQRHTKWSYVMAASLVAIAAIGQPAAGEEPDWQRGDVFLAVGDGSYNIYDRAGNFKESLQQEGGGYTSDCGFSPDLSQLVTTDYTHSRLVIFEDGASGLAPQIIETGETSAGGHAGAVVFDEAGNLFVGHPDGNNFIHKYSPSGNLIETYDVEVEKRGSNWLDLAADQSTVYYTSQGRVIYRYDATARAQLTSFAELPGDGNAQAVRLLAPGDGSGGLLVADGVNVKRLDERGDVVMTYDLPGRDSWFAINLDPDGNSVWATDAESDQVVRFHIGSGVVQGSFTAGGGNTVFGVCLKGEITAAVQSATALPSVYGIAQNAPNPFNPETQISYQLPEAGDVTLSIFNLLGQQIHTLVSDHRSAGVHTVTWSGRDASGQAVSSGVYFYRFESTGLTETRRMLLLK